MSTHSNTPNYNYTKDQARNQSDTFHPQYAELQEAIETTQDCYQGQYKINKNISKYLVSSNTRNPGDLDFNPISWGIQTKLVKYGFENLTSRAANTALGIMFRNDPIVEGVSEDILNNIDLEGNDVSVFSQNAMLQFLQDGSTGVIPEYLKNSEVNTIRDLENSGNRGYLNLVNGLSIVNWETDIINGIRVPTLVTVRRFHRVRENETYNTREIFTTYALDSRNQAYKETYSYDDRNNRRRMGSRTPIIVNGQRLNYIPFNRLSNQINMEIPYLYTSANFDLNIFNSFGRLALGEYKTLASSKQFATDKPEELMKTIKAQNYHAGKDLITSQDVTINNLEFSGTDVKEYRSTWTNLKAAGLEVAGISDISSRNVQSSEALAIKMPARNARLTLIAKKFSLAMSRALTEVNRLNGINTPARFEIQMDFVTPEQTIEETINVNQNSEDN